VIITHERRRSQLCCRFGILLLSFIIAPTILLALMLPKLVFVVPVAVVLLSFCLLFTGGRESVVMNAEQDQIYKVKERFLSVIRRRTELGRLSQLMKVRVNYVSVAYQYQIREMACGITLEFSNGTSYVVDDVILRNWVEMAKGIESWMNTHMAKHNVEFIGIERIHVVSALIVTQKTPLLEREQVEREHVESEQVEIEQELRGLIVRYQLGSDSDSQQKGKKLALAMEYNPISLITTYSALKQQNSNITTQGESVLIDTAQTILDARNNIGIARSADLEAQEGYNLTQK